MTSPTGPLSTAPYVGRFAPSPTGPLHFGSLIAAMGSYLQARHRGGRWLVRMEDIDPPREEPGAADRILRTLEAYGMLWDGPVIYQSRRAEAYDHALDQLGRLGLVYRCACSRQEAARAAADAGLPPGVYAGTCRALGVSSREPHSLRVRVPERPVAFTDAVQGRYVLDLERDAGDFVLRRRDGLYAYQLAVVVDDAEQGVTEVVRGSDLLDSTPRQIHLQRLLDLPTPDYMHLPVAVGPAGDKLSKQNLAPPLDPVVPLPSLIEAGRFLGQAPPDDLQDASVEEFWQWAVAHWDDARIPRRTAISVSRGK